MSLLFSSRRGKMPGKIQVNTKYCAVAGFSTPNLSKFNHFLHRECFLELLFKRRGPAVLHTANLPSSMTSMGSIDATEVFRFRAGGSRAGCRKESKDLKEPARGGGVTASRCCVVTVSATRSAARNRSCARSAISPLHLLFLFSWQNLAAA